MSSTNTPKKQISKKHARRPRRDDLQPFRDTMIAVGHEDALAPVIGYDGYDMYIEHGGVRIAVRGHPGTSQAKKWIPLFLGVDVVDIDDSAIEIVFTNLSPSGALS